MEKSRFNFKTGFLVLKDGKLPLYKNNETRTLARKPADEWDVDGQDGFSLDPLGSTIIRISDEIPGPTAQRSGVTTLNMEFPQGWKKKKERQPFHPQAMWVKKLNEVLYNEYDCPTCNGKGWTGKPWWWT